MVPLASAISQAERGVQTHMACTPEQHVVVARSETVPAMFVDEQKKLERFYRLFHPPFEGSASEDA